MAAGMRLQAGLETLNGAYTFDVKPRWSLAEPQALTELRAS